MSWSLLITVLACWLLSAGMRAGEARPPWTRERAAAAFPDRLQWIAEQNRGAAPGGIVAYGHSLLTLWRSMAQDLAPLPVHNRGYGGSITPMLVPLFDEIVLPLRPRVLVLATGANDLAGGATPQQVADDVAALLGLAARGLPQTRVLLLSITPCPRAWVPRRQLQLETNRLLRESVLPRFPQAHWVDMDASMVGPDGGLLHAHFCQDQVHFSPAGYAAFAAALRGPLQEAWAATAAPETGP